MKKAILLIITAMGALLFLGTLYADDVEPPTEGLVYEAKTGNVTFEHTLHLEKVDNDCTVCHESLFQQEQGNLGTFGKSMHKNAIKDNSGCASCHNPDGESFPMKKNCKKCHIKG